VRENAESVAFYRGERDEQALLEEVRSRTDMQEREQSLTNSTGFASERDFGCHILAFQSVSPCMLF
jgi:hypothetical protein